MIIGRIGLPLEITRLVFALVGIALLNSCLLQLQNPELEVDIDEAYNDDSISVPFVVLGFPPGSTLEWELLLDTGTEFVFLEGDSTRVTSDDSGLIDIGFLEEGYYQLIFSAITSRGSGVETVPSLSRSYFFFVDRTPPDGAVAVGFTPVPGALPVNTAQDISVTYDETADTTLLSPQRVLVVAEVGVVRPPLLGVDELTDGAFRLWDAGQHVVGTMVTVTWVIVDLAGNRSSIDTETYTGS